MTVPVDLNCDMGESFGRYTLGQDEEVLPYVTSANIACGYHAGDPMVMDKSVRQASQNGVGIGAHPSYPDLQGFGRRPMNLGEEELKNFLIYQIGALHAFARVHGCRLQHVKIHGALSLMAATDAGIADVAAQSIAAVDPEIIFLAQAGSEMNRAGQDKGLKIAREFFADRNYDREGNLLSRKHPEALVKDREKTVERTVRALHESVVITPEGERVKLEGVDTVCIHGDSPEAASFAYDLRNGLEREGVNVKPLGEFVV